MTVRLALALGGGCAVVLAAPIPLRLVAQPVRPLVAPPAEPADDAGGGRARRWRRPGAWPERWRWALVAALVLVDPLLALVATAVVVGAPTLRRLVGARRRTAAIERAVPEAIELLVLVIRAGLTPHQAVDAMATHAPRAIRPGFESVQHRLRRGAELADALAELPAVLGPAMAPTADTLSIAVRHGSAIGDALGELSLEVRHRRRRRAEADARRLPIRLSFPLVCCTLPSFVLVAIAPAVLAALSSLGDTAW